MPATLTSPAAGRTSRKQTRHHVRELSVAAIRKSPENDELYAGFSWDNHDDRRLYGQIKRDGRILDPLRTTADRYLKSGHRRLAVAIGLGMKTVPAIVDDDRRDQYTSAEWLKVLLSFNVHREKTFAESLREAVVEKSGEQAHRELVEAREAREAAVEFGAMELDRCKVRSELSGEKAEFVAAILQVLEDNVDDLPLSVRRVHYLLATAREKILRNTNPRRWENMRHRHKTTGAIVADEYYGLDHWSAADLSSVLTRLRSDGRVPWDSIIDDTRPTDRAQTWDNASEFVRGELHYLFRGYRRDLMKSQPFHYEVLLEKLGLRHILKPVCDRYAIQLTIGKGYSSADVAYRMAERFRESKKDKLVLLVMTDHDPDGLFLGESIGNNLLRDHQLDREQLVSVRVGLTREQAQALDLPTNNEPKDVPRARSYIQEHGRVIWELDAASPDFLRDALDEAIRSRIDVDLFNAELGKEKDEARILDRTRQQVFAVLKTIVDPEMLP